MRGPAGRCPNCSAPIRFRWSSAVQTTCESCRSVIVRHDVDVEAIGEVSDLPQDASPIQLGTEGTYEGRAFTVVGRIVYAWADGGWNEWHLVFADGSSRWLSDAQAEYAITALVSPTQPLPAADALEVGTPYAWQRRALQVATLTTARYVGVEGELPFEYWGKEEVRFADLRGHDATFATIDYSEAAPLLFVGQAVEYDDLALRNVRTFAPADVAARGFNCPTCGGAVELRALSHTQAVACTTCGTILDPRDPNVRVLQTAAEREAIVPAIPLGARGTWDGHPYDVIGFQRRSIEVEGTRYHWDEYVLFNPYQGFRYFSVYDGHWNDIETVRELPEVTRRGRRPRVRQGGQTFAHFQSARARTDYVLGEFPWRVRSGDVVVTADYIAPPYMLSSESTDGETTWSRGTYTSGRAIWKAFGLQGAPPRPVGVFANQPSDYGRRLARAAGIAAMLLAALVLVLIVRLVTADREQVFAAPYTYAGPADAAERAFVTPVFALREPGTVEIRLHTTLRNAWLGFDLALVDVATGTAYNVAEEVSFYAGADSDGPWTEGSQQGRVLLPRMPAGEYYLRVEPESDPTTGPVDYRLEVRRDVPSLVPYVVALVLLLVPPFVLMLRMFSFEHRRMQESDHAE